LGNFSSESGFCTVGEYKVLIHIVKRGESLSLIAQKYKKFGIKNWQEIYKDDLNKEFRLKRGDQDIIHPGDQIIIPLFPVDIDNKIFLLTRLDLDKALDSTIFLIKTATLPKLKLEIQYLRHKQEGLLSFIEDNAVMAWVLTQGNNEIHSISGNIVLKAQFALSDVYKSLDMRDIKVAESKLTECTSLINEGHEVILQAFEYLGDSSGQVAVHLDTTSKICSAVVGTYLTMISGGTIAGPAILANNPITASVLLAMINSTATETGKNIAGVGNSLEEAALNVATDGFATLIVGKVFSPGSNVTKGIAFFSTKIAGKVTPQLLKVNLKFGTETVEKLFKEFIEDQEKQLLEDALKEGAKLSRGKQTFDEFSNKLLTSPSTAVQKKLQTSFITWMIKTGLATKILT